MLQREVGSGVVIADQPSLEDLRALRDAGFTAVVNLRHDGEPEQPLGTAEEGALVRDHGLAYHHYAVGGAPLTPEGVRGVATFVSGELANGGKVLLHCRKGARAAALALLHEAIRQNWAAETVVEQGAAMGLAIGDPRLRAAVEEYLRVHGTGSPEQS